MTLIVGGATDGTGSGTASYEYQVNSGTWTTVPIAGNTGTIILTGPDGSKAVNIRAIDAVGNVGTRLWELYRGKSPGHDATESFWHNVDGEQRGSERGCESEFDGHGDMGCERRSEHAAGHVEREHRFHCDGGRGSAGELLERDQDMDGDLDGQWGWRDKRGCQGGIKVTATDTAGNTASAVSSTTTVPVDDQPPNPAGIALSVNSAGPNGAANQSSTVTGTWDVSGAIRACSWAR